MKNLTNDNLEDTLSELRSISTSTQANQGPNKSTAQVHFLAQLISEFITQIESSNVAKLANRQAKVAALESILVTLSHQQDFPTVICKSLSLATSTGTETGTGSVSGSTNKSNSNVALTFTSLVQYLTNPQQKRRKQARNSSLSNLGIITFTTAVCSGWHFYSCSDTNLILDLASRILISSLEKEDLSTLTRDLRESIIFAFTTSEVRIISDNDVMMVCCGVHIDTICMH